MDSTADEVRLMEQQQGPVQNKTTEEPISPTSASASSDKVLGALEMHSTSSDKTVLKLDRNTCIRFRQAKPGKEDCQVAELFYKMWLELGTSPESVREDWLQITVSHMEQARKWKVPLVAPSPDNENPEQRKEGTSSTTMVDGLGSFIAELVEKNDDNDFSVDHLDYTESEGSFAHSAVGFSRNSQKSRIIGSVNAEITQGLSPPIHKISSRLLGHVWGVYVEPEYRGKGIAKRLMTMSNDYLKSIGCTRASLNASEKGKAVYAKVGYVPGNEMRLYIKPSSKKSTANVGVEDNKQLAGASSKNHCSAVNVGSAAQPC